MEVENATESSRAVVLEFCRLLDQPDLPAMLNLLHDDVTWTMVGDPENCFFGGVHSKQKVYEILDGVLGAFHKFSFDVLHSFAEGENVAVRGKSHGIHPNGREYKNVYLMQYKVKEGKIVEVVEHFNPLRVFQYLNIPVTL